MNKYNVIELFAGAGGLALGLEQAGFTTKIAIEINKWATKTLKTNRPQWNIVQEDITKISEIGIKQYLEDDEEIDLLSGGYPCQSFSYAGKKLGLEDTRGTLFSDFAKILKEIKPKIFLAENVKGLSTHDKGKTLQVMLDVFQEVGYCVTYKVLNSLDYSVAQKRQRIVIIGIRDDIKEKIGVDYTFPKPHIKQLTLKDILQDVPHSPCATYNEKKKEVLKYVPAGGCWRDLPDDVARDYMKTTYFMEGGRTGIARRLSWDEAGLTVLCTPAQKQTERCHPDELRPFSVRENARIQSFPDEWIFEGSIAEQYKQIGNAVPVNMAKEVGISIIKYLDKLKEDKKMRAYNLSFISDSDLFNHVKETIEKYRFKITLKEFNKNLIDPIKLTFDAKVYGKTIEEIIESESIRQMDKSNTNNIGYFQQNIFKYIYHKDTQGTHWSVPKQGFDIINEVDKIYVEMKNKHNTMNSSSSQKTFMRMQSKLLEDRDNRCYLVEVIAKNSQDIKWQVSLDGDSSSHENIRRVSIDKFYALVSGEKEAFKQLVEALPLVMDDVLEEIQQSGIENSVFEELEGIDKNILKSLYLLSFEKYEGFSRLQI
ncbi:MAG: Eco47II family restriction endonuclease [Sulfurovum sp.]|nr:Eco47II family restriction endonuclease [Sulfurovum sp.]